MTSSTPAAESGDLSDPADLRVPHRVYCDRRPKQPHELARVVVTADRTRLVRVWESVHRRAGVSRIRSEYPLDLEAAVGINAYCQACRKEFPLHLDALRTAKGTASRLESWNLHVNPLGVLTNRDRRR